MTVPADSQTRRNLHGRRHGHRLRPRQRDLLEHYLPGIEVTLPEGGRRIDPTALFGGAVDEVWLEVGFGGGEHLAAQAAANPPHGMIGCEPFINGVARLIAACHENKLNNVRVFVDDARLLLEALPDGCLTRIFILFPDPWPKRRHQKRRFVSASSAKELARVLRNNGELRIATDHGEFCRWALFHILSNGSFVWPAIAPHDWRERYESAPETRYERKAVAAGRRPTYLSFVRKTRSP